MNGHQSLYALPCDPIKVVRRFSVVGMQYIIVQHYKDNPTQDYICGMAEYRGHADRMAKILNETEAERNISYVVEQITTPL